MCWQTSSAHAQKDVGGICSRTRGRAQDLLMHRVASLGYRRCRRWSELVVEHEDCWMCFELEEKLEFSSYLALVLVPHWIGDGRLDSTYTNSSHAYCYECWAMGHIPTCARTHTSNRTGFGLGVTRPRPADTNAVRFRGLLNLKLFFDFSILILF